MFPRPLFSRRLRLAVSVALLCAVWFRCDSCDAQEYLLLEATGRAAKEAAAWLEEAAKTKSVSIYPVDGPQGETTVEALTEALEQRGLRLVPLPAALKKQPFADDPESVRDWRERCLREGIDLLIVAQREVLNEKVLELHIGFLDVERGTIIRGPTIHRSVVNWFSILPSLVAIVLAIATRRVLLSLFIGIWVGTTAMASFNPLSGLRTLFGTYVWHSLTGEFQITILIFIMSLIGMVGVVSRCGGTQGIVDKMLRFTQTARSARLATAVMGLLIFFDDYSNTIVVGTTMRPVTDRLKVSREKLAYIVDSTAAPVAGIALVSTWIGYEVGLIGDAFSTLDLDISAYGAFIRSIPFRFYCVLTLAFVFVNSIMRRDFGPMYTAEKRAADTGQVTREGATGVDAGALSQIQPVAGVPARWYNAAIPIGIVLLFTVVGLWYSGGGAAGIQITSPSSFLNALSLRSLQDAFSNAKTNNVLALAAISGSIAAFFLARVQGILSLGQCFKAWFAGSKSIYFVILILLLAWSIGGVCRDMGTAHYLVSLFQNVIHPIALPLIIFALAGLISFSTGTSWGTMAILLPISIPLAFHLKGMPLTIISLGSVLEGSIFGDHCSPISDTTIMSSMASSCDHIDHVRTQMPYAVTTMLAAALCGYLPAVMGVSPFICWGLGVALLIGVLLVWGRQPFPRTAEHHRSQNSDGR